MLQRIYIGIYAQSWQAKEEGSRRKKNFFFFGSLVRHWFADHYMMWTCAAKDYFFGIDQVEKKFFYDIFWLEILQRVVDWEQGAREGSGRVYSGGD